MQKDKTKIKITLKYDDGKEKRSLIVDKDEMESFLENEYKNRIFKANTDERNELRQSTIEEYVKNLNRESYNNWHKYYRHKHGYVKKPSFDNYEEIFINPVDFIADNSSEKRIQEFEELDYIRERLYKHLPQKQADLLWAIAIEQTPISEIARKEGVTKRAIYLRLKTARNNFKKYFSAPSLF